MHSRAAAPLCLIGSYLPGAWDQESLSDDDIAVGYPHPSTIDAGYGATYSAGDEVRRRCRQEARQISKIPTSKPYSECFTGQKIL